MRAAILISGSGSNMEALARSMTGDHPGRPVLVLSNVPGAGGLERAGRLGIPTATVDHRAFPDRESFEAALAEKIAEAGADWILLAGFMRILTPGFVAAHAGRIVNIHPSLLPKYPGLDTHARALAAGDTEAGVTVHEVTAALDAGPILGQARVPVEPGDTAKSLAGRVLVAEHVLYPAVVRRLAEGNPEPLFLP